MLSPQEYLERIKSLRNPDEIKVVCEELTSELFNSSDKPKTRANKLTPYNKVIKEIPNEELTEGENAYIQTKADGSLWKRHLHFKFTGLADTQWYGKDGINTKTIVLDRLENRRQIDVTSYLETTSRLLTSTDPHELAVGLIAASGRRPVEILARGRFAISTELPEYLTPGYFLNFKGQAKKRDYDLSQAERTEYRIGVLVAGEIFVKAFNRFRRMPETKELLELLKAENKKGTDPETINDMIESRRGNSLRRVVSREFGSFLPARFGDAEVNNKSLRAAYVRLITDRDCPKNIADLLWASRSVGHFIDTENPDDNQLRHLLTTLGYYDYYTNTEVLFMPAEAVKPRAEKSASIRANQADAETIKHLQEKWNLPNQQAVITQLLNSLEELATVKAQLLEAEAKIKQIEEEPQMTNGITEDLRVLVEQMVEQKVAEAIAEALPQSQAKTASKSKAEPKPKEVDEVDYEGIPSEELKGMKSGGAAREKLRRSFLAICNYNDHQPSNDDRWVINNQALRQLSGCNGMLVKEWMSEHQISIDDHNNKYGLGLYHNKCHKQQVINDVVSW